MPRYRFAIEHTGRPYHTTDIIPADAWTRISQHTTYRAASRLLATHYQTMRTLCGPGAWPNHYRIVALVEMPVSWTFTCAGWTDPTGKPRECEDGHQGSAAQCVTYGTWIANEPEPPAIAPGDWPTRSTCPHCDRLQRDA